MEDKEKIVESQDKVIDARPDDAPTAADRTGINADRREPIDPRMTNTSS